jgi:adenine deaminase
MDLGERITHARGGVDVDLTITNCLLVNVLSGRVHPATVAISGGIIVGIDRDYRARQTIDLSGRYLAPGLIDAHVHIESSMLTVPGFAEAVVPRGTTTVVTDCHEIANVMGLDGIRYMLDCAALTPLEVLVMLPSCVPATLLETSGAELGARDLETLIGEPGVIGLGELMNFPGTIAAAPDIIAKLELFTGMPVDGHAPGLTGTDLSAYIAAGPDSDHECMTAGEAEEKMQKGMYIFMREGTGARNLLDLLPVANAENSRRCCLCTDDRHPVDLLARGHIDSMLNMAVQSGVSPLRAVQMATINSARRFGLPGHGAIAVGYRADMVAFDDLESFNASMVFKGGLLVATAGRMIKPARQVPPAGSTFNVAGFALERLRLPATGSPVRVIEVVPGQITTGSGSAQVGVEEGSAVADPAADLLKIAVVERHRGTGNVGVAFVRGFGLRSGALASSVAHDSHNVVVVGCTDADIAAAVARVVEMGGGQVVAAGGEVLAELALPIAGLMSPLPAEEVAGAVAGLNREAAGLGCVLEDPFMTMSFLALPVIPELKLTDRGLVDVGRFEIVGPFAD